MGSLLLNQSSKTGIALDIGGTTTDFGLFIKGEPAFKPRGIEIDAHPTLIRGLYSHSIALGGDSAVWVEAGALKIGPKRQGAAAALGGPAPSPTDALLVLDKIKDQENQLDFELKKAEKALAALKTMLSDVRGHIPALKKYYLALPNQLKGYKKFFAVNNSLGLATLDKLEANPDVFYGNKPVKTSKLTFLNIIRGPEKYFLKHCHN